MVTERVEKFIYENRYKIFKTLMTYGVYICIGMGITALGSVLLDLQIRVNLDFATASYSITARSVGHIIGATLVGMFGHRHGEPFFIAIGSLLSALFIGSALFFTNAIYTMLSLVIVGIAHGMLELACNSILTVIWKEKCSNWLQILHMSWGIGSLVVPVICRPFLLPTQVDNNNLAKIAAIGFKWKVTNVTTPTIEKIYTSDDVMVQYAFLIIATIQITFGIPFAFIYFKEKNEKTNQQGKPVDSETPQQNYSLVKVYTLVIIVAVINHLGYAVEIVIGSLGPSFSVLSDVHMEKQTGVLLTTVFWSCFSFYRLIYIPLTFVISKTKLLSCNLLVTFVGLLITVPWANNNVTCIWTGFTFLGIGISPLFSAAYGMLSKKVKITSKINSMIFIPAVLGESIHPAIAAILLSNRTVNCLWYLGLLGIIFLAFYLMLLILYNKIFKTPNVQMMTIKTIQHPRLP